jgi:hypothetical protein
MTSISKTIPEGLDVITASDQLTIRRVWLNWMILPFALFAVLWDLFIIFWYHQALAKPTPVLMLLFPIGHVAVGIGITYYVMAALVNKTDVILHPSSIQVVTGPAPWIGNKKLDPSDVTEVIVRERSSGRGRQTFDVMYAGQSRKEKKLVWRLPERDQAEYIAQTIRARYGLN